MASLPLVSNVPTEQDIQMYQGAPWIWSFACVDASNNPLNMTGGTILATIRATQSRSASVIATFTLTWTNQAQGIFVLSLTSETTDAFSWSGNAYWDCFFEDANSPINYYPLVWGVVTLQNDISY